MCASSSRTDEPRKSQGFNQSPNPLAADLTTNQDLNGIANWRANRAGSRTGTSSRSLQDGPADEGGGPPWPDRDRPPGDMASDDVIKTHPSPQVSSANILSSQSPSANQVDSPTVVDSGTQEKKSRLEQIRHTLITFSQFVGPGFMISVAYSECHPLSPNTSLSSDLLTESFCVQSTRVTMPPILLLARLIGFSCSSSSS